MNTIKIYYIKKTIYFLTIIFTLTFINACTSYQQSNNESNFFAIPTYDTPESTTEIEVNPDEIPEYEIITEQVDEQDIHGEQDISVPETGAPEDNAVIRLLEIPAGENIFPKLNRSERNALHVFFSNFAEAWLFEYNENDYDSNALINFALWHNYINYEDRWNSDLAPPGCLAKIYVDSVIERFFGIKNIDHTDYNREDQLNWSEYFIEGYYSYGVGEGDPLSFANVHALYNNNDGTYTAVYGSYCIVDGDIPDELWPPTFQISDFYTDKENWPEGYRDHVSFNYSAIALIEPYIFNGRQTYRLLVLELIE